MEVAIQLMSVIVMMAPVCRGISQSETTLTAPAAAKLPSHPTNNYDAPVLTSHRYSQGPDIGVKQIPTGNNMISENIGKQKTGIVNIFSKRVIRSITQEPELKVDTVTTERLESDSVQVNAEIYNKIRGADLGLATGQILHQWNLKGQATTVGFNAVFQSIPDTEMLQAMQALGFAVSFWTSRETSASGGARAEDELWTGVRGVLADAHYKRPATYLFVGTRKWIQNSILKVIDVIDRNDLQFERTKVVAIVTDEENNNNNSEDVSTWHLKLADTLPELFNLVLMEPVTQSSADSGKRRGLSVWSSKSYGTGVVVLEFVGHWTKGSGLWLQGGPLLSPAITNFQGRELILTTLHKPRVFELKGPDGKLRTNLADIGGYVPQLLAILRQKYNFTYVLTVSTDYGALRNGSWTGMSGVLIGKRAHLSPMDYAFAPSRLTVLDYSEWYSTGEHVWYSTDPIILVSQAPQQLKTPWLLLKIFSWQVWLCLVGVALLCGVAQYAIASPAAQRPGNNDASSRKIPKPLSLSASVAASLKIFLLQGSSRLPASASGRLLSASSLFVVISVYAFYQGNITAFLAVPRRSVPIDSAEDLMARLDHVTPVARINTFYWRFIERFPNIAPIYHNIKLFSDDFLNSWEFFKNIYEGKYSLVDTLSSGAGRAANLESQGAECRFYISRKPVRYDFDVMAHRRNSIYRTPIDKAFRNLKFFGIAEYVKQQFYRTPCERMPKMSNTKPLSLEQVQSALYILAVGLLSATISWCAELLHSRICRSKHTIQVYN